jgi:hypothetical protein
VKEVSRGYFIFDRTPDICIETSMNGCLSVILFLMSGTDLVLP